MCTTHACHVNVCLPNIQTNTLEDNSVCETRQNNKVDKHKSPHHVIQSLTLGDKLVKSHKSSEVQGIHNAVTTVRWLPLLTSVDVPKFS